MATIYNTRICKKTTLENILSIIGEKCMVQCHDGSILGIITSVYIDSNIWVYVYDINNKIDIMCFYEDIRLVQRT